MELFFDKLILFVSAKQSGIIFMFVCPFVYLVIMYELNKAQKREDEKNKKQLKDYFDHT